MTTSKTTNPNAAACHGRNRRGAQPGSTSPWYRLGLAVLAIGLLGIASGPFADAQTQLPPVANATVSVTTVPSPSVPGVATLDGSTSLDPDGDISKYKWEVLTDSYLWITINQANEESPTATFEIPSSDLAARFGPSIEFRLTVTDNGTPAATSSFVVTFTINQPPVIEFNVWAKRLNPDDLAGYDDDQNGIIDDNGERYTLEGIINGPGENGNDDNEWHIRDGSLLVIDGSGSSDPNGQLTEDDFSWERVHTSDVATVTQSLPVGVAGKKSLSTDEDPDNPPETGDPPETVALLPYGPTSEADPYYLFYRLTVTDGDGAMSSRMIKIVIFDYPSHPDVTIGYPVSDPQGSDEAAQRAGVLAAGKDRYVVSPETARNGITLTATGKVDRVGGSTQLTHLWSGPGVVPSPSNQLAVTSTAVFTSPPGTVDGDSFTIEVEISDPAQHTNTAAVELVVAENAAPTATAPPNIDTPDGNDGGFPLTDPPTGVVVLRGIGFDSDGDSLAFKWRQVADSSGTPLTLAWRGPRLLLSDTTEETASFELPEVTTGTQYVVYVEFEVTDVWGVSATDIVQITIRDGNDDLRARAGPDQRVLSGSFVRLQGGFSSGLVSADTIAALTYSWTYKGIETHPSTQDRPPVTDLETKEGFIEGQWFPYDGKDADDNDVADDDSTLDGLQVKGDYHPTAAGKFKNTNTRYPYFDAPQLDNFSSVKLIFELTISSGNETQSDTIIVTVVNGFFSGAIDSPDFCTNLSLGGPTTYAFDTNGDGIADICSLPGTRRFSVARQNALETLAVLNLDEFKNALHGLVDDPDTLDVDESTNGTCASAPTDLGDSEEALLKDICGQAAQKLDPKRSIPAVPDPVDPIHATVFFSGNIKGPDFCTNLSLGGPTTYPFDSNSDGVADTCVLPFTRRVAVARQNALETAFGSEKANSQYPAALAAACAALGTLDFGDDPVALANDGCNPPPSETGNPLPTSAT